MGTRLGGYRLESLIGSGAVGDVFRARDVKLAREVAVKVLHPHLATDPDRLRRFQREALAVSALNHPNIVHIYDFGQHGETPFLVMELVEGRTLRQILADGPLPVGELIEIALQLADGLAKAHAEGIVHRDLKPDNVIMSRDGYVKIVDFGLAKLFHPPPLEGDGGHDGQEDLAAFVTRDGALMGTAAYMSPEQASGGLVDFRSDLFSLSAIFYELATGSSAFRGDSVGETLVAVLRGEPTPILERNAMVPADFQRIADRCLSKKADQRHATTSDLARELRALRDRIAHLASTSDVEGWAASLPQRPRRRRVWLAAGLGLLVVAAGVGWMTRSAFDEPPPAPPQLRLLASSQNPKLRTSAPALSGDGKMFVYVSERADRSDLFVGRVAGGDHVQLTDDEAFESTPSFSPNGDQIAFARVPSGAVPSLAVVPSLGGPVTTIVAGATMPAWSADGRRLAFVMERGGALPRALGISDARGGDLTLLLEADGALPFFYEPSWSPDGRLLAVQRSSGGVAGEIWLVPVAGGAPWRLDDEPPGVFMHEPVFLPDGRALVVASNRGGATNLWRLPLDGGAPTPLTSGPGPDTLPSVAVDGSIAFMNSVWRYTVRVFDLGTRATRELVSHNAFVWAPAFSLDGTEITFSQAEADGAWHLWSIPTAGGEAVRRTDGAAGEVYPRYSAHGILYNDWNRPRSIWRLAGPNGPRELLVPAEASYGDVSPDGRTLAFVTEEGGEEHVFLMPLGERTTLDSGAALGGRRVRLTASPGTLPRWSPDGRWIAFARDRGVRGGISVIAADGTGERRLTEDGGWPTWVARQSPPRLPARQSSGWSRGVDGEPRWWRAKSGRGADLFGQQPPDRYRARRTLYGHHGQRTPDRSDLAARTRRPTPGVNRIHFGAFGSLTGYRCPCGANTKRPSSPWGARAVWRPVLEHRTAPL